MVAAAALVVGHRSETGRDDEELGGDEVEFGSEGEEAGVERGLGLGLFEGLAVMEVCMGEYAPKAASKRGKMAVGRGWDGEAGCRVVWLVYSRGTDRRLTYREGKARGELRSAVALSRVWRI